MGKDGESERDFKGHFGFNLVLGRSSQYKRVKMTFPYLNELYEEFENNLWRRV